MNDEKEIEKKIKVLEGLAGKVLEIKNQTRPKRPIVLEFCGTPKAGKTSCIASLNLFLKRNGFQTITLTERASICPVKDKFNPLFNIWTVSSAIAELSAKFQEGRKLDVIISDRGIFDGICWFHWAKTHDRLLTEDYEAITGYLTMEKFRSMIDLIYVFTADHEIALEREYTHLLTRKRGTVMNDRVIGQFNNAVAQCTTKFGKFFRHLAEIDTTNLAQDEVSYEVTYKVLESLYDILDEKVGYIDRAALCQYENKNIWGFSELDCNLRVSFGPRDQIESSEDKVQPIPIIVFTNHEMSKILVVKKSKESLSPDSPENEKTLVYFGGHMRKEDNLSQNSAIDFSHLKSVALSREILEELNVSLTIQESEPLCIWTKDNKKSKKHFAIVHIYKTDLDQFNIKLDDYEFTQKTGKSKSGRILKVSQIMNEPLERWSKIILNHFFGQSIPLDETRNLDLFDDSGYNQ